MNRKLLLLLFLFCTIYLFTSCNKPTDKGNVTIEFEFEVNGQKFLKDNVYTNDADNDFKINDLKFFISNIKLQKSDGDIISYNNPSFTHLVDINDKSTYEWRLPTVEDRVYKKIGFTFGLDTALNFKSKFENYSYEDMLYEDSSIEGFNYMIMDLKWWDDNLTAPQNLKFKLGRYPVFLNYEDDPIAYDEYYFAKEFDIPFEIKKNTDKKFIVTVDIGKWFSQPNVINFAKLETEEILSDNQAFQTAMQRNGTNVFSLKILNKIK